MLPDAPWIVDAEQNGYPFDEEKHDDGCWNCTEYDGSHCMLGWNNADPAYYNPDTDDKDPDDWCPGWEEDKNAPYD